MSGNTEEPFQHRIWDCMILLLLYYDIESVFLLVLQWER